MTMPIELETKQYIAKWSHVPCIKIGENSYFREPCVKPLGHDVTIGHQVGENPGLVWFSHWFVCPIFWEHWWQPIKNGVVWHRAHEKVTKTYPDGRVYIWILRDEFDINGRQLGVWPD